MYLSFLVENLQPSDKFDDRWRGRHVEQTIDEQGHLVQGRMVFPLDEQFLHACADRLQNWEADERFRHEWIAINVERLPFPLLKNRIPR